MGSFLLQKFVRLFRLLSAIYAFSTDTLRRRMTASFSLRKKNGKLLVFIDFTALFCHTNGHCTFLFSIL